MLTREMRAEIRRKREPSVMMDGKLVPGSVPLIRQMLESVVDPHDRDDLLSELAGEYLRADLDDEHLLVQRERVANHPEAAIMWLALAHSLSMRKDGAEEAKRAAAQAVKLSHRDGTLVRYALTGQAEVALKTRDAILFEATLKELIADAGNERQEDSGFRSEIVDNLPPGFCSPQLEAQYRRILSRTP